MKNENSDEKVTSINPVNQSQRAHCMQLAEALHKNNLITVAVYSEKCNVKTDVNFLQITKSNSCHTLLTLCTLSLYLHIKATGIDVESQSVPRMGNQWPQTFIMGKSPQRGCVFLLPRVMVGWLVESEPTSDTWEGVIEVTPFIYCNNHFYICYVILILMYVCDYSKLICQVKSSGRGKHYRTVFLFCFLLHCMQY